MKKSISIVVSIVLPFLILSIYLYCSFTVFSKISIEYLEWFILLFSTLIGYIFIALQYKKNWWKIGLIYIPIIFILLSLYAPFFVLNILGFKI